MFNVGLVGWKVIGKVFSEISGLGVDNINDNCKLASDLGVLEELRCYKSDFKCL